MYVQDFGPQSRSVHFPVSGSGFASSFFERCSVSCEHKHKRSLRTFNYLQLIIMGIGGEQIQSIPTQYKLSKLSDEQLKKWAKAYGVVGEKREQLLDALVIKTN